MKLSATALAFAAWLALSTYASPAVTSCSTSFSTASPRARARARTGWTTITTSCTSSKTVTKTERVTPPATTSTRTVTTTRTLTARTTTYTATTTTTNTIGTAKTTTITTTVTSYSGSGTSTSTVPAPAGFIPVQSSLDGSSYDGAFGNSPAGKRDEEHDVDVFSSPQWPYKVSCTDYRQSSSCTAKTSTTTLTRTAMAATIYSTVTSTATTTTFPAATTTITKTSTAHMTNIVSTTFTSTHYTASTITVYAACATNNIANLYGGRGFQSTSHLTGDPNSQAVFYPDTAYECCSAAIHLSAIANDPNSHATVWAFANGTCNIAYKTSTSPQSADTWQVNLNSPGVAGFAVGNGPNGEFVRAAG